MSDSLIKGLAATFFLTIREDRAVDLLGSLAEEVGIVPAGLVGTARPAPMQALVALRAVIGLSGAFAIRRRAGRAGGTHFISVVRKTLGRFAKTELAGDF